MFVKVRCCILFAVRTEYFKYYYMNYVSLNVKTRFNIILSSFRIALQDLLHSAGDRIKQIPLSAIRLMYVLYGTITQVFVIIIPPQTK